MREILRKVWSVAVHVFASTMTGIVFGFFLIMIAMFSAGVAPNQMRQEAVKHNAAHWEANIDGTTNFVWNDTGSPK